MLPAAGVPARVAVPLPPSVSVTPDGSVPDSVIAATGLPVVITEKAREAMEDYLGARTDPSPALFIGFQPARKNSAGNRLTVQGANHVCHQLALRLGIPPFHPHRLRHTLGTFLQETMGDARLTAETLGHRGLASVSGYTKITDARKHEAYEQMQRRGL